jgi:hypothetical protein
MRFSLRRLLLAIAYVALVAAAVGTQSPALIDVLWAGSLIAGCYAIVLAFVATGRRRAMAIGFVTLAAAYAALIYLFPGRSPVMHAVSALGYTVSVSELGVLMIRGRSADVVRIVTAAQIANPVSTLAAGLIGAGIGALAYRNSKREQCGKVD